MAALLPIVLLFFVVYAVMIRPQQRRAREHQALMAAVQVGEEVMTTAGIFGRVTDLDGDVVSIEISPGVVMRVARAAIGRRMTQEPEADQDEHDGFDGHAEIEEPQTSDPHDDPWGTGEPPAAPPGPA